MAVKLSQSVIQILESGVINPNLILEIDGINTIYGSSTVLRKVRFDEGYEFDTDGLNFDTPFPYSNSKDLISIAGTTQSIGQQLQIDTNVGTSITSVTISLVDKDDYVTKELTTGATVEDVLSRRAKFYLGFVGLSHPEDSIKLFDGVVQEIEFLPGEVKIRIQHPETLKKKEIFPEVITVLSSDFSDTDLTISVEDASLFPFPIPSEGFKTYIKLEKDQNIELIEYTGISGNTLTGLNRAQFGSIARNYLAVDDYEVKLLYRITGRPINIALKLMLSGGNQYFNFETYATSFVRITPTQAEYNGIQLIDFQAQDEANIVVGNFVSSSGANIPGNNFIDRKILAVARNDFGTLIIVDGPALLEEPATSAIITFKSQFDVYPSDYLGCNMSQDQVDVIRHVEIDDQFQANFPEMDFLIYSPVEAKDFIHRELYRPVGLYVLPRGSLSSVNYTNPPLAVDQIVRLDSNSILNPADLSITRSLAKYFYNSINHRFNEDRFEENRFLRGQGLISGQAVQRFNQYGNRPMTIQAKGLRADGITENLITIAQRRLLDRYKFTAEYINGVKVNFKTGLGIELGDTVVFGDQLLKIADNKNNSRNFAPRLMEVVNKKISITGEVTLDLVDTAFSLDRNYFVVSPSSFVSTGSTNSIIVLQNFVGSLTISSERDKWRDFIGELIKVHSVDHSVTANTVLRGFDPGDPRRMLVDPLPFVPGEGYIVDIIDYSDNNFDGLIYKNLFGYFDPQCKITSGVSNTQFNVSLSDASLLFIDSIIEVRNADFSLTFETKIIDITGTLITVESDMGFTPNSSFVVDLIGFVSDKGLPYGIL